MGDNGYKDPSKEMLGDGRAVADVMRGRGPKGVRGVIVAPAGVDGKSINFDPHDKNNLNINVVNPNGSTIHSLHLADFTKDAIRTAVDAAKTKIPGADIESIRERAAMAFEELATLSGSGVVKRGAAQPQQQLTPPPAPAAPVSVPIPGPADIDRNYSPMAAFGLKRATTQRSSAPASAAGGHSGPPSKLVYFEKEGIGTVPAFFHDVIIELYDDETGFIVLIYDLGFEQAAARWFPPADDPYKRPWAVQIQNETRLYLVHTTGFQFTYNNREFCVLQVEKSVNAEI